MDDVVLDLKVLIDKISTIGIVGDNTTYLRCRKKDILWPLLFKKGSNILLIQKVQFSMGLANDIGITFSLEVVEYS